MASVIRSFTKDELQKILDGSTSIANVLRKIGLHPKGHNSKTLRKIINEWNLDITKLEKNFETMKLKRAKNLANINRRPDKDVFTKNSNYNRKHLKSRILKNNLIEYRCSKCNNVGEWMEEELVLQLEHKNGIHNDNRLENLCFLCPNCHSQTDNFCGRSSKKLEKERKKETEKGLLVERRFKLLENIDTTKFGWIGKTAKLWGTTHSHVREWVDKYYPDLETFKRSSI